jgi:hypothetical protein
VSLAIGYFKHSDDIYIKVKMSIREVKTYRKYDVTDCLRHIVVQRISFLERHEGVQ